MVATIAPSPAPFLDQRTRREAEERMGTAEATIERTKAAVERAKAQAEQANNDLARTRTLVEREATTVQALERAEWQCVLLIGFARRRIRKPCR